jgi:hypothetical protein
MFTAETLRRREDEKIKIIVKPESTEGAEVT